MVGEENGGHAATLRIALVAFAMAYF